MKDMEEVLQDYLNHLKSLIPDIDVSPASEITIRARVLCARVAEIYYHQEQIRKDAFPHTATGEALDAHAYDRGIAPRKQATRATGMLRFSRVTASNVARSVPMGTQASVEIEQSGARVTFATTQPATLPAGGFFVDVEAVAVAAGANGNIAAGVVLDFAGTAPTGIERVEVIESFVGGTDTENDEELRARMLVAIQSPDAGGTADDYKKWALGVRGVTAAVVLPLNRGPGTVDIVIASDGLPTDELVDSVQNLVDQKRPIGADPLVLSPVPKVIDVHVSLTLVPGVGVNDVQMLVEQAIQTYIDSIPIGGVVRVTGVGNAVHDVDGVLDFAISTPAVNVVLAPTELARVGVVVIS